MHFKSEERCTIPRVQATRASDWWLLPCDRKRGARIMNKFQSPRRHRIEELERKRKHHSCVQACPPLPPPLSHNLLKKIGHERRECARASMVDDKTGRHP